MGNALFAAPLRWLALIPLLSMAAAVLAADARADAAAQAWVGRDASELLTVFRVDGGRINMIENEATGETAYRFVSRGRGKRVWVSEGHEMATVMTPVAGSGGQAVPVTAPVDTGYHEHKEGDLRCDVTFHADADGSIVRWEYTGEACGRDIEEPAS